MFQDVRTLAAALVCIAIAIAMHSANLANAISQLASK